MEAPNVELRGASSSTKRQRRAPAAPPLGADEHAARVARVAAAQDGLEEISNEVSTRILELERDANVRRAPLYATRREALGALPQFWATALANHPVCAAFVSERDQEILEYLTDLRVDEQEDITSGYRITLTFGANPFFANETLHKELRFSDDDGDTSEASTIAWKAGEAPSADGGAGADGGGGGGGDGGGGKRSHDDLVAEAPPAAPTFLLALLSTGDDAHADFLDEEADALCDAIKDELWPNPLRYYELGVELGAGAES